MLRCLAAIIIVFGFNQLYGQQLEWLVKPVVDEGYELWYDEKNTHPYIGIKNRKKAGLIDGENRVITPPEYQYVNVTANGHLIQAKREGNEYDHFTVNGEKISREKYEELHKKYAPWGEHTRKIEAEIEQFLSSLKSKGSKIYAKIGDTNINRLNFQYDIYNSSNVIIANNTSIRHSELFNDRILSIYDEETKTYMLVDIFTEKVFDQGDKRENIFSTDEYILVERRQGKFKLYSPYGDLLREFDNFSYLKERDLGISYEDGVCVLYNLENNTVLGQSTDGMYTINGKEDFVIFDQGISTEIYEVGTGDITKVDNGYVHLYRDNNNDQIVLSDQELKGVWSIVTNDWIVSPAHGRINSTQFGHYVLSDDAGYSRYASNILVDAKGVVIYDEDNLGIHCLESFYHVLEMDSSRTLRSYDGASILKLTKSQRLRMNTDLAVASIIDIEDRSNNYSVHVDRLFDGHEFRFDRIDRVIKPKEGDWIWYIIKKGKKLGIMNSKGQEILPVEYDLIRKDKRHKRNLLVKKDGKVGLALHP